jgi:D-alanyl-D-alanine carboxypeptidase/D-alanyl-D-alanine-endopeptidase (penicillin-binding protein 4)
MRRRTTARAGLLAALLPGFLALLAPPSHAATPSQQVAALRAKVEQALAGSTAGSIGVAVDVGGYGQVDRHGATTALPPASTEKLFTTLAALERLGTGYRQRTQLRSSALTVAGHLRGDLYLVGAGDPYFTSAHLNALAQAVYDSGIRAIDGHLVVDEDRYDRVRSGSGWKASWMPQESGPLSAMALDRNAWRADSAYLADPAPPVLGKLRAYLAKKGIAVSAVVRRGAAPSTSRVVASHVSAPLSDVVRRIDKVSDNFAAELLLKELGRAVRGRGTAADGVAVTRQVLGGLGVTVGTVADGSGLSTTDRQSSAGEMSLLGAAQGSRSYPALRAALPIACQDGTLVKRLCGTAAAGKTVAKSGTLDTVRSLAGWTTTADGHVVRFSFLLASYTSGTQAVAAIDRAVVVLASAHMQ